MAKRSVSVNTITVTAFNDATNMTSATYPYIVQGGTATQRINVLEIYMGGLSTASTPTHSSLPFRKDLTSPLGMI